MLTTSQAPAFIRTYVPILVTIIAGWFADRGLDLGDEWRDGLALVIGGLAGALYYAAVRLLEKRWPNIGMLLGIAKTPDSYSHGPSEVVEVEDIEPAPPVDVEPPAPADDPMAGNALAARDQALND